MKFRKKPVVIEAVQWLNNDPSYDAIGAWLDTHEQPMFEVRNHGDLVISTLEGEMVASPGDWIIRGVKGEFYPCKPDIFAATYEVAE